MAACEMSEVDKKEMITQVGNELAQKHGQKPYYKQREVGRALDRLEFTTDVHCWAYSFFLSHDDFDFYHSSIGEACDYVEMKSEVIACVTDGASLAWYDFDFDLSWLDWPDFDISDLFDF